MNREDRTNRLYQWLSERARFFRSEASGQGTSRTIRTELTVERQATTLLISDKAEAFDTCPLCGSKLVPSQAEQAQLRLRKGLISQDPFFQKFAARSIKKPP